MRATFILLFLVLFSSASAQVVNSLSKDTTGFYGHALDSAIAIIKENKNLRTVYVTGRECVKHYLPDTLRNVAVKWRPPGKSKRDRMKLRDDEIIVVISCFSIIRDEVTVVIHTAQEGDWMYRFLYYFQPDTKDYKLTRVYRGMRL